MLPVVGRKGDKPAGTSLPQYTGMCSHQTLLLAPTPSSYVVIMPVVRLTARILQPVGTSGGMSVRARNGQYQMLCQCYNHVWLHPAGVQQAICATAAHDPIPCPQCASQLPVVVLVADQEVVAVRCQAHADRVTERGGISWASIPCRQEMCLWIVHADSIEVHMQDSSL
jgi:hypothetical protein